MQQEVVISELFEKLEQFEQFIERKLVEDNERQMEMRYWEYVEQIASMTK